MSDGTEIRADLRYTADHEWAAPASADGVIRVGITDYAQNSLGDIVFVQLPDVGTTVAAGDALGEVESTKSVSDVVSPIAGEVVARNDQVEATPELANTDPYGDGWLVEIKATDAADLDGLLDAAGYREITGS